jgi:plasmid stabilization system protein ParE
MVNRNYKVVIDIEAKKSLREAYNFIKKDSPQNAERVKKEILVSIKELVNNPEKYPPDKYRINNDASYRAYELHRYRISYVISPTQIRVIRIRHTKMNPFLDY